MAIYTDPYQTGFDVGGGDYPAILEAMEQFKTPLTLTAPIGSYRRANAYAYGPAGQRSLLRKSISPRHWRIASQLNKPYDFMRVPRTILHSFDEGMGGVRGAWKATGAGGALAARGSGELFAYGRHAIWGQHLRALEGSQAARVLGTHRYMIGRLAQRSKFTQYVGGMISSTAGKSLSRTAATQTMRSGAAFAAKHAAVRLGVRAALIGSTVAAPVGLALLATDVVRLGGWAVGKSFEGTLKILNESMKDMNKGILQPSFVDYSGGITGRQRAVAQIQNSRLNARTILGNEAALFHQEFG